MFRTMFLAAVLLLPSGGCMVVDMALDPIGAETGRQRRNFPFYPIDLIAPPPLEPIYSPPPMSAPYSPASPESATLGTLPD
jgi:hypothetical protein